MFEELLGAFMALILFALRGVGGCRWLMFEEVLGAFMGWGGVEEPICSL